MLQTDSLVWLESTRNRSDGQTYRGMSPVVDDVMDAGRRMQQQELPPLIPCYCQRVSLINPASASHVQIKFNVYLLKECNKHIWTDYTYTLVHTHFINIWIMNTDAKFRFNYYYNSVTYHNTRVWPYAQVELNVLSVVTYQNVSSCLKVYPDRRTCVYTRAAWRS